MSHTAGQRKSSGQIVYELLQPAAYALRALGRAVESVVDCSKTKTVVCRRTREPVATHVTPTAGLGRRRGAPNNQQKVFLT